VKQIGIQPGTCEFILQNIISYGEKSHFHNCMLVFLPLSLDIDNTTSNAIPMESSPSSLSIVVEALGIVKIYEDGTVDRLINSSIVPPSSQIGDESKEGVTSKDVIINPQTCIFASLFLPRLDENKKFRYLCTFTEGLSVSNQLSQFITTMLIQWFYLRVKFLGVGIVSSAHEDLQHNYSSW
jgi:hypothetical protein